MFLLSSFEEGFTSKEKNKRIYRFSLITKNLSFKKGKIQTEKKTTQNKNTKKTMTISFKMRFKF